MLRFKFSARIFFCFFLVMVVACKPKKYIYKSPPHYNFSKPQSIKLDTRIREISGVVWDTHNNQFIAHNDESPSIFYLDRGTGAFIGTPFKFTEKTGDYEDIAMIGHDIYVLKSDGMLFKIVTDSAGNRASVDLGKIEVPGKVDFETLYYDQDKKALIMICKNCESDDKKTISAFAYYPDSSGFDTKPVYTMDAEKIKQLSPRETSKFQPSAARMHPVLKKLFIISSASNQLVIADPDGTVNSVYMLARKLFPQPEGLTFKSNGEMYISNEGVSSKATLLKFIYMP